MLVIYTTDDVPAYVNREAADLLREWQEKLARYALDRTNYVTRFDRRPYHRGRPSERLPSCAKQSRHANPERPVDTIALAANGGHAARVGCEPAPDSAVSERPWRIDHPVSFRRISGRATLESRDHDRDRHLYLRRGSDRL